MSIEAYDYGKQDGIDQERERIIKLLETDAGACNDRRPMSEHIDEWCNCRLIALIKDDTKQIRSEILPNGTIYIEEVKGENK